MSKAPWQLRRSRSHPFAACLKFIGEMQLYPEAELGIVLQECEELPAIFAASIRTACGKGRDRM
jgi:hypothetical protein